MEVFFQWLISQINELTCVTLVRPFQGGVRFFFHPRTRKVTTTELEPGLHWRVPYITEDNVIPVAPEPYVLRSQTVETQDGTAINVDAIVVVEIVDVVASYVDVQSFEESVVEVAGGFLAKRVSEEATWDSLRENRRKIERSIKDQLTTAIEPWGGKVLGARLGTCVKVKPYRLIGNDDAA